MSSFCGSGVKGMVTGKVKPQNCVHSISLWGIEEFECAMVENQRHCVAVNVFGSWGMVKVTSQCQSDLKALHIET